MITFGKIGKKGNLGNHLFQIASTIGLAVENNLEYGFLPWQHQQHFKNKLPSIAEIPADIVVVNEAHFHHHHWDLKSQNTHYDLVGWLQSEQYFDRAKTKFYFEFEDAIVDKIKSKYATAFQKRTILISIRRGDFVNHPDYLQLSIKYYLNALVRFFPDWESYNLVVLSDDIAYCKFHFSFLKNAFFGDGLNAIEQLCLGSLCDDFIISNSTFSWWSAWLGEKEDSKVVCPHQNFAGKKRETFDDKDYYPTRWLSYNAQNDQIKLDDITVYLNFKNNSQIISDYLLHYFEVAIQYNSIPAEAAKNIYCFKKDYVLPPVLFYYSCLKKLDSTHSTIVNNVVKAIRVSKKLNYDEFAEQLDFGIFSSIFNSNTNASNAIKKQVFLTDDLNFEANSAQFLASNALILNVLVGQFCSTGYAFSFKRYRKRLLRMIKGKIKKALLLIKR